jgi:hypothetical protein
MRGLCPIPGRPSTKCCAAISQPQGSGGAAPSLAVLGGRRVILHHVVRNRESTGQRIAVPAGCPLGASRRSTQSRTPSCHAGSFTPKTRSSLEQSSAEFESRPDRVA